jgi:hypothetical protein
MYTVNQTSYIICSYIYYDEIISVSLDLFHVKQQEIFYLNGKHFISSWEISYSQCNWEIQPKIAS